MFRKCLSKIYRNSLTVSEPKCANLHKESIGYIYIYIYSLGRNHITWVSGFAGLIGLWVNRLRGRLVSGGLVQAW